MKQPSSDAHWRDSARPIRFFMWDGKAVFPLILFLMYPRWWTLGVALATMMFFTLLIRYGLKINVFLRWLRTAIAGNRKFSKPWWME
jgi:intracellular multiplication protein IcmT